MRVRKIIIHNFRGVKYASLLLPQHAVLIGDNNTGKTTVLEALDLVLGPERLNRFPPVDEHDFFKGRYISQRNHFESKESESGKDEESEASNGDQEETSKIEVDDVGDPEISEDESDELHIRIDVVVVGLSAEQETRFGDHVEWWDDSTDQMYDIPNPEGVDADHIDAALRVTFIGQYNDDDDDFEGNTYFTRSLIDDDTPTKFGRRDKQFCGFLYLRSLRTGSRALSLERGSLLDIILRLREIRPQMWEGALGTISSFTVTGDGDQGLSGVLESINQALKKYVPRDWGAKPHLRVSNLTREHLRKIITAFMATGEGDHAAPFYRQGTGTINMLVLAMLSQIAEDKQNVIFAMEEPETAIPPYAQKRIIQEILNLASQALFTSHSPYVLEEFSLDGTVVLARDNEGMLTQSKVELPNSVKPKRYRQEFRTRFCEGLLARRILVAEGATEATSIPVAARRLSEINPSVYSSLEAMGICTIDAGGESNVADMASLYANLNKRVFAVCDKQSEEEKTAIEDNVERLFMHGESSMEKLVLNESCRFALKRFAGDLDWPQHIIYRPELESDHIRALREYFEWSKGNLGIADFLAQCHEEEMPEWIRTTCASLRELCDTSMEDQDEGMIAADPVAGEPEDSSDDETD